MLMLPILTALAPILAAGVGGAFSLFGARQNSENTQQANLMNWQLAQQQMAMREREWVEAMRQWEVGRTQWERSFAQAGSQWDHQVAAESRAFQAASDVNSMNQGMANRDFMANMQMAQRNIDLQREFAQNGVRWRVEDARRAGINPLAALGGTGAAFSPGAYISGGSLSGPPSPSASPGGGQAPVSPMSPGSGSISSSISADTSMGNALHSMGQDVSKALDKALSAGERSDTYTAAMQVANLEKTGLENELLRSQIARLRQNPSPPMPGTSRYLVDGQAQSSGGSSVALVTDKAMERTPAARGAPHAEPGAVVDAGYARTPTGWAVIPSKDVKERIEDNFIYEAQHFIRNNIAPLMSNKYFKPPNFPPSRGHHWAHNPITGEYHQVPTPFQRRFEGR